MMAALQSRRRMLRAVASGAALAGLGAFTPALRAATEPAGAPALRAGRASRTAQGVAVMRAAHQLLDAPLVFEDPLALRVIGAETADALRADPQAFDTNRGLRAFLALRSRYAEDALAAAVARGVRQYVVLGAGLDTSAFRTPHAGLRIFEVDHPATQTWKRERLIEGGIAVPASVRFVPVDFETQSLAQELRRAGLRADEPAYFSWLGVVVYLTRPAINGTLQYIASLAPGSEVVFDYSVPAHLLTLAQRSARAVRALRVMEMGEPWLTYYDPADLAAALHAIGYTSVYDLEPAAANARYFARREDGLRIASGRLMRARV
jgi:methyltransferase (TIGR00027 family)